jgi:DNA invertase Pin-like site-specific DNA recombinase
MVHQEKEYKKYSEKVQKSFQVPKLRNIFVPYKLLIKELMKKTIVLSRVSTDQQTLESQTGKVLNEVLRYYKEEQIIIIENKESAVKKSEEELLGINEMKQYIEAGNIESVYCYELSRLSRRPKVLYSLRDYFLEHNVQLIVLNPFFKLLDDNGEINESSNVIFSLYATFAEQEAKNLKERCRRGRAKRKAENKFIGGKDPFGYSHDKDKNFIINEEEAQVVREMFNMYAYGESKLGIARKMRARGYFLNFQSAIDCHTHIDNVLHNRDYTGQNGKPRIISDALFDIVQTKFPGKRPRTSTKRLALGRSFIFNPDCQTKRKLYYVNTTSGDYFSYTVNKETRIFAKIVFIDSLIWYVVKRHYKRVSGLFRGLPGESESINKKSIKLRLKTLTEDVYGLNEAIQKIEERLIYGKLSESKAEELEKQIEKQIKSKNEQIEELTKSLEKLPTYDPDTDIDSLSIDDKCRIVKAVFSHMTLRRNKKYSWTMEFWLDSETVETYEIYTRIPEYYRVENGTREKINVKLLEDIRK